MDIGKHVKYSCVFELRLIEEKEKGYQRDGDYCRLLLRNTQRLCLPSSLSSAELVLVDANDAVE